MSPEISERSFEEARETQPFRPASGLNAETQRLHASTTAKSAR